jgi:predicted double-glycine peptidase
VRPLDLLTRRPWRVVLIASAILSAAGAMAGQVEVRAAGQSFAVPVRSLKETRFRSTLRQRYDFSCGSAALATLLTHHYESPVTEEAVFRAMYEKGDKEEIRREGFSLLDMKRYLESAGYRSDGYRVSLDAMAEVGIPAIALVNDRGYKHFVVIKGVSRERVLVGDPAQGVVTVPRPRFESMWSGILFVIRDRRDVGQRHFNESQEWQSNPQAPLRVATDQGAVASFSRLLPLPSDF